MVLFLVLNYIFCISYQKFFVALSPFKILYPFYLAVEGCFKTFKIFQDRRLSFNQSVCDPSNGPRVESLAVIGSPLDTPS